MAKLGLSLYDFCMENEDKKYLLDEWDYTKNIGVNPKVVTRGSHLRIWWRDRYGHEWQACINDRTCKNSKCPYCSGKKVQIGINDLATLRPDIANEWHPFKNNGLKPTEVFVYSLKKVWWLGKCNHEWETQIATRTSQNSGCPYCKGKKVLVGFNDLNTLRPDIAKYWHPTKNGDLKPTNVTVGTDKKVWWMCEKGHEWERSIGSTVRNNSLCPTCTSVGISRIQATILYYIKKVTKKEIKYCYNDLGFEIDIYIPELKVGIEYDGYYFHKDREQKDIEKNKKCKEHNIKLYRIREKPLKSLNSYSIDFLYNFKDSDDLRLAIYKVIFEIFKRKVDINFIRDMAEINDLHLIGEKEKSLEVLYPTLAKEWHPKKNGILKPSQISYGSEQIVWWKGNCGHEWSASVKSRSSYGNGCPYCAGNKVLIGFNDLKTTNPEIAKEWHPTKNGNLKPTDFTAGSEQRIWWRGTCGHEWEAIIKSRKKGHGCPYCANKKVLVGFNDLVTTHSEISKLWHPIKNEELKPIHFVAGSEQKIYWLGTCGHEWSEQIKVMVQTKGEKCPYCSNRKVLKGFNDLMTTYPKIAKEWNYSKNGELNPTDITSHNTKKVWWVDSYGHEWEQSVFRRTLYNCGCPICSNKKILVGFNDLKSTLPEVLKYWDYEKNTIKPTEVMKGSSKEVWWIKDGKSIKRRVVDFCQCAEFKKDKRK